MSERRIVDRRAVAPSAPRAAGCPHLGPMCGAVLAAAALLGLVRACVEPRLPGLLPFYAAHAMSFKVNANVLQKVAFRTPDELPVYGSSELDAWVDDRPDAFFRNRPTGFAVFPVGRGGATCLMILQKLAALGEAARGKQVVIILSSAWFLHPSVSHEEVGANLAGSQLSGWLFGESLSAGLKSAIARRMRDYAEDFKGQTLNLAAVRLLARPTLWNRLRFALLRPLGKVQNALLERLDYGVLCWEMVFPQRRFRGDDQVEESAVPAAGRPIDWEGLIARAEAGMGDAPTPSDQQFLVRPGENNQWFTSQLNATREFDDLVLLVRVLQELKMKACFISQPINANYGVLSGVVPSVRRAYYERLEAVLRPSGYPLIDFSDREADRYFFVDEGHPSAKAWVFYDRAIDRFCSGRKLDPFTGQPGPAADGGKTRFQ